VSESFVPEISEISVLDYLRLPVEIRREVFINLAPVHRLAYIDAYCELNAAALAQGAIMQNIDTDPLTEILNADSNRKERNAKFIKQKLELVRSDTQPTDGKIEPFKDNSDE